MGLLYFSSLSLPLKIVPRAMLGMRAIGCRRLVYRFLAPCSLVGGYRHPSGSCCFQKVDAAPCSDTFAQCPRIK
jgi:hypothetical protein